MPLRPGRCARAHTSFLGRSHEVDTALMDRLVHDDESKRRGDQTEAGSANADDQAAAAVTRAKRSLLDWHARFSRFEPDSELCNLNRDPRGTVPFSPLIRRIVAAAVDSARATDGLVDPTLVAEIERAGYRSHF